jgi:hypothetical protein
MTYHSDNGSEQLLHEKFARPIAIGFRSVEYDAPPAAGTDTDATKQASSK